MIMGVLQATISYAGNVLGNVRRSSRSDVVAVGGTAFSLHEEAAGAARLGLCTHVGRYLVICPKMNP